MRAPVVVVPVDRLAAITPRGDVVDGVGEFDAQGAGHFLSLLGLGQKAGQKARLDLDLTL